MQQTAQREAIVPQATDGGPIWFHKTALEAWDLSQVKRFMVERKGLEPAYVDRLEREYRRFIHLSYVFGKFSLVPTCRAVDEMWHAHILFTRDYMAFCEAVGEGYLHHLPTLGDMAAGLVTFYKSETFPKYVATFGEQPPADIWLESDAICWGEGGGGNCN